MEDAITLHKFREESLNQGDAILLVGSNASSKLATTKDILFSIRYKFSQICCFSNEPVEWSPAEHTFRTSEYESVSTTICNLQRQKIATFRKSNEEIIASKESFGNSEMSDEELEEEHGFEMFTRNLNMIVVLKDFNESLLASELFQNRKLLRVAFLVSIDATESLSGVERCFEYVILFMGDYLSLTRFEFPVLYFGAVIARSLNNRKFVLICKISGQTQLERYFWYRPPSLPSLVEEEEREGQGREEEEEREGQGREEEEEREEEREEAREEERDEERKKQEQVAEKLLIFNCPLCRVQNSVFRSQPTVYNVETMCIFCLAEKAEVFNQQCGHVCLCWNCLCTIASQ